MCLRMLVDRTCAFAGEHALLLIVFSSQFYRAIETSAPPAYCLIHPGLIANGELSLWQLHNTLGYACTLSIA